MPRTPATRRSSASIERLLERRVAKPAIGRDEWLVCGLALGDVGFDQAFDRIGHSFCDKAVAEEVPDAVEKLVDFYISRRQSDDEPFIAAFRRLGKEPFKEALYGNA